MASGILVPDKRTPESVFKVRLHIRIPQSAKRMIIKATLRVTWNQQKRPSKGWWNRCKCGNAPVSPALR